jgi:Transposase DDE domain group 1
VRSQICWACRFILRARILAIACGYEDADDLDHLRRDPAFKLACGKLPDSACARSSG